MTVSLTPLLAVSALVVTCEKICADGILPEHEEAKLRRLIIVACNAFEIPTIAERPAEISRPLARKSEMFRVGEGSRFSTTNSEG